MTHVRRIWLLFPTVVLWCLLFLDLPTSAGPCCCSLFPRLLAFVAAPLATSSGVATTPKRITSWKQESEVMEGGSSGICHYFPLALLVTAIVSLIRVVYVFYWSGKSLPSKQSQCSVKTLVVLGSGGHTAEMLNLLAVLHKDKFVPRVYVAAATDNMSLQKARVFEVSLMSQEESAAGKTQPAQYMQIYRSREVGQSYITSIATTIIAMVHALWITFKIRPQVVICNGPGTCIPLCLSAFLFKVIGIRWSSIFYVESIARVRRLSLSGLLLYKLHLADQFFVQWPQLKKKYPRTHYVGCLM